MQTLAEVKQARALVDSHRENRLFRRMVYHKKTLVKDIMGLWTEGRVWTKNINFQWRMVISELFLLENCEALQILYFLGFMHFQHGAINMGVIFAFDRKARELFSNFQKGYHFHVLVI